MSRSSNALVLACNDALDTCAAPCPLYKGKDQDGKCGFGPVRSIPTVDNSTTLSSDSHHGYAKRIGFDFSSEETAAVTVCCRQPVLVIVFMDYKRIMISLHAHSFLQNVVNGKSTQLHTCPLCTFGLQQGSVVALLLSQIC